jgi:integrase
LAPSTADEVSLPPITLATFAFSLFRTSIALTTAIQLLQAGVDTAVIALWLGHESVETTKVYIDADLALKEKTIAKTAPLPAAVGRYKPSDRLLAFLDAL